MVEYVRKRHTVSVYEKPKGSRATGEDTRILEGVWRESDPAYLKQVITLHRTHPRLGKKKIAALLGVSESYAGRTLCDLKKRNLLLLHQKVSLHARSGQVRERCTITRTKK